MAAAVALSVLLHLSVFLFRLSGGGDASSAPVHAAAPLAVRLISVSKPAPQTPERTAVSGAVGSPAFPTTTVTPAVPPVANPAMTRAEPVASSPESPQPMREPATATPPAPVLPAAVAPEQPAPRPSAVSPPVSTGYAAAGLDPPPRPLDDIAPDFPEAAGTRGGSVVLRLFINETGGVDRIEVVRSTPPGLFDAAALAAFGSARYSPGFLAGVPVRSQVMYEVEFARQARDSSASGRTY